MEPMTQSTKPYIIIQIDVYLEMIKDDINNEWMFYASSRDA